MTRIVWANGAGKETKRESYEYYDNVYKAYLNDSYALGMMKEIQGANCGKVSFDYVYQAKLNNDWGYRINSSEKMERFNNAKKELGAISRELNHRYSSYWSFNTQKYAMDRYLRNMSIAISCGY